MGNNMAAPSWQKFGQFDPKLRVPIAQPLKTVEEVLEWSPEQDQYGAATFALVDRKPSVNRYQTLVCHDMAGGYLDDRFVQGIEKKECYQFHNWHQIDSFVYFSHYFVTIPPPSWTNAAHKHGVPMLGTFITEWDDGKKRCDQFLESEAAYQALADKMVSLMVHYKFDGWLVNIENKIVAEKVDFLRGFVQYLTEKSHASGNPHAQVLWYDSVTKDGNLKWQNCLNDLNKLFFDVSDGIFLNYGWKQEGLEKSKEICMQDGRPYDVYVGADVWGRGCPGGGGYHTDVALQGARSNDLSVAIFAQAWTWENQGQENFIQNESKFWDLLTPLTISKYHISLPISSSFCQGQGYKFYQNGKVISDKPWNNLSLQRIQPSWRNSGFELHTDEAYNGGACLKIVPDGQENKLRLMTLDTCTTESLIVSYTVKKSAQADVSLEITFSPTASGRASQSFILGTEALAAASTDGQATFLMPMTAEEVRKLVSYPAVDNEYGWETRYYLLPVENETKVHAVSIVGCCGITEGQVVLFGQVQIMTLSQAIEKPLLTNLECSKILTGEVSTDQVLTWTFPDKTADHYLVFGALCTEDMPETVYELLGSTHISRFMVCSQEERLVPSLFKVQPVTQVGVCIPLDKLPSVKLSF